MSPRESANGEAGQKSLLERRTFVRIASDLDAACRPAGSREVGWPGRVRDISRGGVGLLLKHRFQPGTLLTVELRDTTGDLRRTVRVRVIHATSTIIDGAARWHLGCEFETPLSDAEFEALQ